MRFKDERQMWFDDVEDISRKLANKTEYEIAVILEDHDVIQLRSCDRPKTSIFGRILFPFVFFLLIFVCAIKWIITGNQYLDSIVKRIPFLGSILEYCGIK